MSGALLLSQHRPPEQNGYWSLTRLSPGVARARLVPLYMYTSLYICACMLPCFLLYLCTCYIHICVAHAQMHCASISTSVHMPTCMCLYISTSVHVPMCLYISTSVCTCPDARASIYYIHIYLCAWACLYILYPHVQHLCAHAQMHIPRCTCPDARASIYYIHICVHMPRCTCLYIHPSALCTYTQIYHLTHFITEGLIYYYVVTSGSGSVSW